jgi:hypothetical protein
MNMPDKSIIKNSSCDCQTESKASCCSSSDVLVDVAKVERVPSWVMDLTKTPAGMVPRVATNLNWKDMTGSWKARWGIGRMNYIIPPGLYAVGKPDKNAPVLVTANYKMSFDRLRKELTHINAWILVLDTKGINVWCAAGKGTFGTHEIINRIGKTRLAEVVSHGTLILPQLGAPGVAAYEVHKATGFKIIYGPVQARDLPAFLKSGNVATSKMREVPFTIIDRLVLTPMELVGTAKYIGALLILLFVISLIRMPSAPFLTLVVTTFVYSLPFLGALFIGTVLTPALLPFIPGRAFAWKGWLMGFVATVLFVFYVSSSLSWKMYLFYLLALPAISSYLTMNFTGASTYTSLSGVVREMKTALPVQILSATLGLVFLIVSVIVGQ